MPGVVVFLTFTLMYGGINYSFLHYLWTAPWAVWQSPPTSVVNYPWKVLRGVDNMIFTFTLLLLLHHTTVLRVYHQQLIRWKGKEEQILYLLKNWVGDWMMDNWYLWWPTSSRVWEVIGSSPVCRTLVTCWLFHFYLEPITLMGAWFSHDLKCSVAFGHCRGTSCTNATALQLDFDEDVDEDEDDWRSKISNTFFCQSSDQKNLIHNSK